jgi:hypothetical protein
MDWPLACGPGAPSGPGQHAGQHCSAQRHPEGLPGQPQDGLGVPVVAECSARPPPVQLYMSHSEAFILFIIYYRCQYWI